MPKLLSRCNGILAASTPIFGSSSITHLCKMQGRAWATFVSPMLRASLADAVGWFRGALRVRDRGNVPQGRSGEGGAVPPRRLVSALDADRGGRVAPPAADPSQATGRVKRHDNQLHRARVLEVRIQSPPAQSQQRTRPRGGW